MLGMFQKPVWKFPRSMKRVLWQKHRDVTRFKCERLTTVIFK